MKKKQSSGSHCSDPLIQLIMIRKEEELQSFQVSDELVHVNKRNTMNVIVIDSRMCVRSNPSSD